MPMKTDLKRVIYVSQKTDLSESSLQQVINTSKKNNPEEDITGCLLAGTNSYLQLLEGPTLSVDQLYSKIQADGRHENVKKLNEERIGERLFSSWSMKLTPFDNLEWSDAEFDSGNFLNVSAKKAMNIFNRINEYERM